jgi:hypothetical protein
VLDRFYAESAEGSPPWTRVNAGLLPADQLAVMTQAVPLLLAAKGWASPEVGRAYEAAERLAAEHGSLHDRVEVHIGLWSHYLASGNLAKGGHQADALRQIAADHPDDANVQVATKFRLGAINFWYGQFVEAERELSEGMSLYKKLTSPRFYGKDVVEDPFILFRSNQALTCWMLGRTNDAEAFIREAIGHARDTAQVFGECFALNYGAWLSICLKRFYDARTQSVRMLELAREHGFPSWIATGRMQQGLVDAWTSENPVEGLGKLLDGIKIWRTNGANLVLPFFHGLAAEVWLAHPNPQARDPAAAGRSLDGADEIARATGESFYASELLRLRAEQRRQSARPGDGAAEAEVADAIERAALAARRSGARAVALRIARDRVAFARARTGLAVDRKRDQVEKAERLCRAELGKTSQGHDTSDVRDAKRVLWEQ